MPGIFFDEGLLKLNRVALKIESQVDLSVIPYVNNVTLDNATEFADFTLCSVSGAGPTVLTPGSWSTSAATGEFTATYPTITLTFASYAGPTQTVYGILVYDDTNNIALWGQALGTAFAIPLTGGIMDIALNYLDGACP